MGLISRKRIKYQLMQYRYRSHACNTSFDWDWRAADYNRIALVNLLVSLRGGPDCNYLEIGCASNELFSAVHSNRRTGVDPEAGGTRRETSDQFFAANREKFDVIFIDGLHEYEQVRRDCVNALACLADGGWIAFHDFLPRNWKEQHVPRLQAEWTGDCWKMAVELAESDEIDFRIFTIDYGVGVMRPKKASARLADRQDELRNAQYDYFVNVLDKLPRTDWADGVSWLRSHQVK